MSRRKLVPTSLLQLFVSLVARSICFSAVWCSAASVVVGWHLLGPWGQGAPGGVLCNLFQQLQGLLGELPLGAEAGR